MSGASRAFALAVGAGYVALAVFSLLPQFLHSPAPGAPAMLITMLYGELFGWFPVNAVLTLIHFVLGFWGVAAFVDGGAAPARAYARGVVFAGGAMAVLGVIPAADTIYGLIPLWGNDAWLHAASAVLALPFAFAPVARAERRQGERRQEVYAVREDRRGGRDRRTRSTAPR